MNHSRKTLDSRKSRRWFDATCAAVGLVVLSPLLGVIALLVLLFDGRPVLFGQMRAGQFGKPFRIWKFRTMRAGAGGLPITAAGDRRITWLGARLRKFKLDEIPQLFNVLMGDMSLVGPRPEVPQYVNAASPVWQAVLQVLPGITDPATLLHRDEEAMLSASSDPDHLYRETVLPTKLLVNLAYIRTRCFRQDVRLILLTICSSLFPGRFNSVRIRRALSSGASHDGHVYSVSSPEHR
jgi:lipopolysaccharide/colanic/teichoic acid biosynthesis glycosyltransferase